MLRKIFIFTAFVVCCGLPVTKAQLCIPNPVYNLELSDDHVLSWEPSENCQGTEYIVIIEASSIIEYEYTVNNVSFNVDFLPLCRNYSFIVTPVANHILGQESSLTGTTVLPNGVDIFVQNFTGNQIADDILLQWSVDNNHTYCVSFYHLLIWSEDDESPTSRYIGQNGYLLEHVAQCMNYRFQLTVYYSSGNGSVAEFNYTVPEKTNTPSLVELRQDASTINTTWSLEKYSVNRCPITALYVNGTHFNQTYEIQDSSDRPDVLVSIVNLRADSMYYFNVSTNNSAGISEAFQIAVQTHPIDPNFI